MRISESIYPNAIADAALVSPASGKRLTIFRIIATNKDGADMQIYRNVRGVNIINLETSKGGVFEFGERGLRLETDEALTFTGGLVSVNTIVTVYYGER